MNYGSGLECLGRRVRRRGRRRRIRWPLNVTQNMLPSEARASSNELQEAQQDLNKINEPFNNTNPIESRMLEPQFVSLSFKSSTMSPKKFSLFLLVCCSIHLTTCQRLLTSSEPTLQINNNNNNNNNSPQMTNPQNGNQQFGTDQMSLKPQNIALLVNLLNSLNQQNGGQQGNRQWPPFGGNPNQARPTIVSTPVNPFVGNSQFPANNNNNRRVSFQDQSIGSGGSNNNNNNNPLPVSTSSPTPYLTLSRLASFTNQQPANYQPGNQNRPYIQPINSIPLGSMVGSQNGNRLGAGNQLMPPPRVSQPLGSQQSQQQSVRPIQAQAANQYSQPQLASRLPNTPLPPIQSQSQPAVRPISGFAPSGPPPSLAASNAMVVVQSPSNAIGQSTQQNNQSNSSSRLPAEPDEVKTNDKSSLTTFEPTSMAEDKLTSSTQSSSSVNTVKIDREPILTTTSTSTTNVPVGVNSRDLESPAKDLNWNPVDGNRSSLEQAAGSRNKVNLAPSPDIVTVPPGYNPDNPNNLPQNYDIAVSTQMGATPNQQRPSFVVVAEQQQPGEGSKRISPEPASETPPLQASPASLSTSTQTTSSSLSTSASSLVAPTAVTTIIWSPPPTETSITPASSIQPSKSIEPRSPTQTAIAFAQPPNRIRDNSLSDEPQLEPSVVYGKPQARDSKPTPPTSTSTVNPSPVSNLASIESSVPASGKPFIQPVQIDNQVRPFTAGAQQQQSLLKSNHGGSSSVGPPGAPFRPSRPLSPTSGASQGSPMHVGSGFTITAVGNQTMPTGDIQDYVAGQPPFLVPSGQPLGGGHHEPTISASGGPDPALFDMNARDPSVNNGENYNKKLNDYSGTTNSSATTTSSPTVHRVWRPTFKPKPAEPPIKLDSCMVDDEKSCEPAHNERCVTEYGISSCHCKPGFARLSQMRGYCSPVSSLQLSLKIDKLNDDRQLVYNQTLDNQSSVEYQYMEFEAIQALAGAFRQTSLAKQFMGAKVNKFYEKHGKVWVNVSVNLESNNTTRIERIQTMAGQELLKVIQQNGRSKPLGDSTIMVDGSKETVSRLTDVNECASPELNDCSNHAICINNFGSFQCQCQTGYEDKYKSGERSKQGRVCLGCSPSYCSNRGECSIDDGKKQCVCRGNFIGARCDIDSEVLAVAIGGSLVGVIILIITFWCLHIFNRRWKREQQKMDAMSATSGLTYNYVNSSTNSLMSPTRGMTIGGLQRSGGHQVGAMAANYGHKFGAAIVNGSRGTGMGVGGQHYAADQQAIIGSTSSGSSAASQPIGCALPYASIGYQYEDAGLLIAPASTGSSEQTSPSGNSYRGIIPSHHNQASMLMSQVAGNAYTLSGHHHHHHHLHHQHHQGPKQQQQLTQFHPAAATDYRTLNQVATPMHCPNNYDNRWRTLQQDGKPSTLVGYYLSPDMLAGHQHQQQMYAAPQPELCIDTGAHQNANKSRRQTLRSRSQQPRGALYHNNSSHYDNERPI